MSAYTGTRCMLCSEKFTAGDDVVVCPDCGTPYHRECYLKEGKCVNEALHKSGGSWKPSYDTGRDGSENQAVVCNFCGNANPPLTLFCRRCGMPTAGMGTESDRAEQTLGGVNINENADAYNRNMGGIRLDPFLINFSDPLCGFDPNEEFDGVKMSELGDFVGTNTHYYLPLFKRFKDTKRSSSWNFCSMLFPELYFSYRKMPLIAFGALLARFVSNLPNYIYAVSQIKSFGRLSEVAAQINVTSTAFRGFVMLCSSVVYALMLWCGFMGNKLYYDHALRKIKKIKSGPTQQGIPLRHAVIKGGGTSGLLLALFICLTALPMLTIWCAQFIAAAPFRF